MIVQQMRVAAAVAAVLAFTGAGFADDGDQANPDTKALLEYVKKLEARVNELERDREWPLAEVRTQSGSALESAIRSINLSGYMEFQYAYNLRPGGTKTASSSSGSSGSSSGGTSETPTKALGGPAGFVRGDALGYNQFRGPAGDDNGFSFQNVQLLADKPLTTVGSTGFRVRMDFGLVSEFANRDPAFTNPSHAFDVSEANMSWRADTGGCPLGNYVDLTVGKMGSPLGLESRYANDSSNYGLVTRNPLLVLLTPASLTGARAVVPWCDCQKTSIYFVNGWDVVRDAADGKSVIVSHEISKIPAMNSTLVLNGSYGDEGSIKGHLLAGEPASTVPDGGNKTIFLEAIWKAEIDEHTRMAFDAFWATADSSAVHTPLHGVTDLESREFHGIEGYLQHWFSKDGWVSGRAGYTADNAPNSVLGRDLRIIDASLAVGWNLAAGLSMAVEYRHDWTRSGTEPFFNSSGNPNSNQDTITASFVYTF